MRTKLILVVLICFISSSTFAQFENSIYYTRNNFSLTSPGAMKYGMYGYTNPALLSTVDNFNFLFTWKNQIDSKKKISNFKSSKLISNSSNDIDSWGIFAAVPNFGFSVASHNSLKENINEYNFGLSGGNNRLSFGLSYGLFSEDIDYLNFSNTFTIGTLFRPNKFSSFSLIGYLQTSGNKEGAIEVAVRPFGNELVSLFGDYAVTSFNGSTNKFWSAGISIEPIPGIRFTGRYFKNEFIDAGIQFSLGNLGFTSKANLDNDFNRTSMTYGIRIGEYDRNIINELSPKNNYVEMNLKGNTKYRRFKFFDNSNTLYNLVDEIEAAKEDKSISGIAINTSGMNINREMLWELRQKLIEFKSSGKKVVIYFDRAGIDAYHFISIADKIVMDPIGQLALEGFLWGRTYYTGTLEKLGIGFSEWRYFKYKSAYENYSREKMSAADKEQLQAIVDDYYYQARTEICKSRNISYDKFNNLVNSNLFYLPDEALENNLIDEIGRWDKVQEVINNLENEKQDFIRPSLLDKFKLPEDNYWGEKPKIAVIYALGICAMDNGINARQLVKDVRSACKDDDTKAIVFRVDSPGGDGLASDIVAEALKDCKKKKPVIISQGFVAASGGYWLSMYGDSIVAAPTTITGSIGVIGGWFYNKELKEEIGVTTDFVKRGEHADLGFGFSVPFIGSFLPDRNLTESEQENVEHSIKTMYKEFVQKVAEGRNMNYDEVEEIAQGRVWPGIDGKEIGLVDVLGGLDDAIKIAVEKAGLMNEEYEVYELPEQPWFNWNIFIPDIFGFELKDENKIIEYLKFRFNNNGVPMPILPIEDMNMIE